MERTIGGDTECVISVEVSDGFVVGLAAETVNGVVEMPGC